MTSKFLIYIFAVINAKNCQDFEIFNGIDYGYHQTQTTIKNTRVSRTSRAQVECEEHCRKTENCVGFVLNRYGSYCVLKSSKGYPQGHSRNQRFISGFLIDDKVKISISNEMRKVSSEASFFLTTFFLFEHVLASWKYV